MSRKMKDSGVEWIGEIPEEWKIRRLKALLIERNQKNDDLKTKFILSLGVNYGVVPYSEKEGGGNKAKENLQDYKVAYPGDIVMNSMNIISGSVGISHYMGCVSPVYYMFYPRNNDVNVNYYHFLFQTKAFQRSLVGLGNGILIKENEKGNFNTVRMRIPVNRLNALFLPMPDLEEQNRISTFLTDKCLKIENIIKDTEKSIEKYKKLKLALITKSVTKGIRKNRKFKDSGYDFIGLIPEQWEICKVRHIGSLQNGISKGAEYFGKGYPFVSYGDVYRNYSLPRQVEGLIDSTEKEQEIYSVKKGDVFFTRTSETIEEVGFSSVCEKDILNATFAGFLIRLRPFEQEKIDTEFLKYYFRSEHQRFYLVKEMNLVTRASLGQPLLKGMPVLVPSKVEQEEIAKYLNKKCNIIDKVIQKKEEMIQEISEYKKSLIYEYITGKREVPKS